MTAEPGIDAVGPAAPSVLPAPSVPVAAEWPAEELEACPACPACGSTDRRLLHAGLTDRVFEVAPGHWQLWRCRACETGFMDPRPTPESIGRAYRSYYTHVADAQNWWLAGETRGVRAVASACVNGRLAVRLGYGGRPASRIGGRLLAVLVRRDRELLGKLRYLAARPSGRLLDIGCGEGGYLALMRALGWTVTGVDPDPTAVAVAHEAGLDVRLGTLDTVKLPDESFDAITLNHSIEHVHDPLAVLRECRRLLAPGGALVVYTPNVDADGHRRFGRDWLHLDPPRHLVLFTPQSLARALKVAGFREVETLPSRLRGASARYSSALRAGRSPFDSSRPALRVLGIALMANLRSWRDPGRAEEVAVRAVA